MKVQIKLKQGFKDANRPIVVINQMVQKGQLIAVSDGIGVNIHASISGKVEFVDEDIITIIGSDCNDSYLRIDESLSKLETIKQAGIVGAGGAGFPTYIKLENQLVDGVCYINAAECEPTLKHNLKVIEQSIDQLIIGAKHVMDITKCTKVVFAIKSKHRKAIKLIEDAIANQPGFEVGILPNIYPAGDERVILRELHDIELEFGKLPKDVNALILNVETVKNIYNAIELRQPVITKDISVSGRIVGLYDTAVYLDVPIGVEVAEYITKAGGILEPYGEIIGGGPFTGQSISLESPVTKTLGAIIVANPFLEIKEKFGAIECECGASYDRLKELVEKMGGEIIATEKCKRMKEINGRYRCEKPGECPGQTELCLKLKKAGATSIIAGTCED